MFYSGASAVMDHIEIVHNDYKQFIPDELWVTQYMASGHFLNNGMHDLLCTTMSLLFDAITTQSCLSFVGGSLVRAN